MKTACRAMTGWRLFASTLMALICLDAHALSIGAAQVRSYIGEPLSVVVPVQGRSGQELTARLQAPAADEQASFAQVMDTSLYQVEVDTTVTPALIRIRGVQPQKEPVLQMMLQLGQGELSMGFMLNILLDPRPSRTQPQRPAPTPAVRERTTTPITPAPRVQPSVPVTTRPVPAPPAPSPAMLGNRPIVPAAKAARPDRVAARQQAAERPRDKQAAGIQPGTEAIFLKPGMFALQTEFNSYRAQREQEVAGVARVQQGEPERFQADWILSVEALPAQPGEHAAGTAEVATESAGGDAVGVASKEAASRPVVAPTQEIELTLPRGALQQAESPQPVTTVRVMPAPAVTAAPAGDAESSAEGASWTRKLLWALLAVMLAAWLWKRRADRGVIRVDYSVADEPEKLPPIVFPSDLEDTPAPARNADFSAPDAGKSELRELREKIRKMRASGKLDEAQLRELQVAEVMLKHGRMDAAERILNALV